MHQAKFLLPISTLVGLGLLNGCSTNVVPENSSMDPTLGTPSGTVVVEPVVVNPGATPTPITGSLPVVTPNQGVGTGVHVVQPGEGLYGIARRYGVNYQQLAAWNNIPPPYTLRPGQQLVLSGSGTSAPAPVTAYPPAVSAPPVTGSAQYHLVQPGETLYRIATQYGLNYLDVAQQNGIPYPYTLSVGQRLTLGSAYSTPYTSTPAYSTSPYNSASTPAYNSTTPGYHLVQPQETLYSLSRRYGYSMQQLSAWNALHPPYTLRVGQSLRVSP